ncbi:MAG: hypothetical protein ABFD07_19035 [Methanobacterium sp.]
MFQKAKTSAPAKTTKGKDEKVRIKIQDASFFTKVEKLEQLLDAQKRDKAKSDMLNDELKDLARDEWAKLYENTGKNPESVMLEYVKEDTDDTAQFMFVPTDKYITITPARAEELQELYGETVVEEKTVFSFDNAMIEKYGEIISRMIEDSTDIAEKDKEKIIKATTTFSVAKGTIDNFSKLGNVSEVMEATKPVVMLKNIGVIKG